jgi:hypothetical protein
LRCSPAGRDGSGRDDRLLVPIELPPLTGSELRRLFLRLPALRALPQEDRTLVARAIGGHPRLIEFVDALLRGGSTELRDTARKLRALAREHRLDLRRPRALDDFTRIARRIGRCRLAPPMNGRCRSETRCWAGSGRFSIGFSRSNMPAMMAYAQNEETAAMIRFTVVAASLVAGPSSSAWTPQGGAFTQPSLWGGRRGPLPRARPRSGCRQTIVWRHLWTLVDQDSGDVRGGRLQPPRHPDSSEHKAGGDWLRRSPRL